MKRFRFARNILYAGLFVFALSVSVFCVFESRKEISVHTVYKENVSETFVSLSNTAPQWKVDINSASKEQLLEIPGIGPVLADRIIEYRALHGSFYDVGELREVKGIGDKTLQAILPYLDT